uniref:Carboxylic ester hydrolase n=1 Tax=Panagrellus redivivus TaxID=6233 RepID=A0A7E4V3J6_PANRE
MLGSLGSWVNYLTGQSGVATGTSGIVEVKTGKVRGKRYTFDNGKSVDAFLGIPYGEGERFKKPIPPKPWTTVLDCTRFGQRCPHTDLFLEIPFLEAAKSENCLNLNVFAPEAAPGPDQPNGYAVMFWVHGGGFTIHSSSHYGDYGICKELCTKDVIVVTINYRLGYFGFLSTGDEHCPGNVGLWDQALALRWVKDNIFEFGGDPNNITVFGQSAGGASSDYLSLSPHTRDLFQKVIPMAGTAMHSFASIETEKNRTKALDFAMKLGFVPNPNATKTETNKAMVQFLNAQPYNKLETALITLFGFNLSDQGTLDIVPVMDGDFLPKSIAQLRVEMPKKTVMCGTTKYEGLFLSFRPHKNATLGEALQLLETDLRRRGYKVCPELMTKIEEMYFEGKNREDKRDMTKAVINLISDFTINWPETEYAHAMVELGHTVYQYCFYYCNKRNMGALGHAMAFRGATHCSELTYIFHKGLIANFYPNNDDNKMVKLMTTMWTNFAKYGNPNGKENEGPWKPLTAEDPYKYFEIDLDSKFKDDVHYGRIKKLRELLIEYA